MLSIGGVRAAPLAMASLSFLALSLLPRAAAAADRSPFFLVELDTGLAESAYREGPFGLAYGAAFGPTFKLRRSALRWAVLATAVGRSGSVEGTREGIPYVVERHDLDLLLAARATLPVVGPMRVYAELGLGGRFERERIDRGGNLGALGATARAPLLVLAAGLTARVSRPISVGLRAQLEPLEPSPGLSTFAAALAPTPHRAALLAQLGWHF